MPESSHPGWYDDPYGAPGLLRWWDGRQWTDATEAGQAPAPEPMYGPAPSPLYERPPDPAPTPAPARRSALPWLLAAGAGLVVIAVVVTVTVVALRGGGGHDTARRAARPSAPASTPSSAPAGARSAVIGTVTDSDAGVTYDRLGSPWVAAGASWFTPGLFTAGQVAVVQEPFERYASFNATSLSGVPRTTESSGYQGPRDLSQVCGRVTARILAEHFAMAKTRTSLPSGARTVDGHQAWLQRFRLDFPDAAAKGWKFRADTVAILVIDTGGGHLAELWVSVPDTFAGQGDVDQVLDSVAVS